MEPSELLSADGMARLISCLMVIFSKLQLDDLGSEDSRACGDEWKRFRKVPSHH